MKVIKTVPSGPDPHEVTVSTAGRMAYLSNHNGGINVATRAAIERLPIERLPIGRAAGIQMHPVAHTPTWPARPRTMSPSSTCER